MLKEFGEGEVVHRCKGEMLTASSSLEEFQAHLRKGQPTLRTLGVQSLESQSLQGQGYPSRCPYAISQNPRPSQPWSWRYWKGFTAGWALKPFWALWWYRTLNLTSSCVLSNSAGNAALLVRYRRGSLTLTLNLQQLVSGRQILVIPL